MLSAIYSSQRRDDEGFTLIELLVVIIVIGILAAIALPIFIDQQKVAIDASVQSDVRNTVTNVTNMQAQQDASAFKVAASKDNTVEVRVENSVVASVKGSSTSATNLTLSAPIALGTAYTVDGYNAGGKQYQGPSVTDGKVFKFTAATGQFTTEVAGDDAAGDGGGGSSTGGGASLPHGYAATPANASFNGGSSNLNSVSSNSGLFFSGSAFGTDGTSETTGAQPLLNGMKPYPDPTGIRQGSASNVEFKDKAGQAVTGYGDCTYTAGYVPAEYGAYFGPYSGDGANFAFVQLSCSTGPALASNEGGKLSDGTVTFTSKEGSNTFKVGTVSLNGPATDTPTELNVGTTASKTVVQTATGYDGTQRTSLNAYLTKNSQSFSNSRFLVGNPEVLQYAGDGSQPITSTLPSFNNVDPTAYHADYPTSVKVYDKDGTDVTSAYDLSTSLRPSGVVQSYHAPGYYIYSASFNLVFERVLTNAERSALEGGKLVVDGKQIQLTNVVAN